MNYLKEEFYQILKSDQNVFDFIQMNAFDGIWFWNLENPTDKWINPKFCDLLGYEYEELQGNQIEKIVHQEDQIKIKEIFNNYLKSTQSVQEDEIRFVHKKGKIFWLKLQALALDNIESKKHRVIVTHTNITKQHNQEDKLNETLERYESMLNNHSLFIIRTDLLGNYSYVNNHFCKRLNLKRDELIGKNAMSAIVLEDHHKCRDAVYRCFANPNESAFVQLKKIVFDKKTNQVTKITIYTDWEYRAILDKQGNVKEMQCVGIEVTDKIIAQKALQEKAYELEASEEELRVNFEQLKDSQSELIHTQKLLDASNRMAQIGTWAFNLDKGVVIGNKITQQIHEMEDDFVATPEKGISFYKEGYSREIIKRAFTKAIEEGVSYDEQLKIITLKGNEIWVRTIGIPVFENGKCIEVYGTFQNIDKQKRNEINLQQKVEELESSTRQLLHASTLLETCNASANIGTWEYDVNTRDISWDKIVNDVYELPQNIELDTQTKINFFKKGQNREKAIEIVKKAREEGKPFDQELEIINFRGNHKWIRIIGIPVVENNRTIDLYGTFQDITKQKQAELEIKNKVSELETTQNKLQHTSQLLETCNEKAIIGIWEFDLETKVNKIDKIIRQIHEVDENYESTVQKGQDRYEGKDKEIIIKVFDDAVNSGISFDEQLKMTTDKGNKKWVRIIGIPAIENGKVVQLYGFIQDITLQKNAELQFKEKVNELEKAQQEIQIIQNKLSTTLEKTGIGIWELDIKTNEAYWDKQTRKMLGVQELPKGAIDRTIEFKYIKKEDVSKINNLLQDFISQKISSYNIVHETLPINGKVHYQESKAVLIKDETGNPISVLGIIQDITKQKEYEQIIEIQNQDLANSEKQLRKGIREMYHLQQNLAHQKQQLEQIFDAVPALIYQFRRDKEGNVSFPLVSKGSEIILGIKANKILDNNSTQIFEAIHPEDLLGFQSSIQKSAENMQKWESELRLLKKGKEVWIHASSKPTLMEDGAIIWTGIMQNIDNLKEAELKVQNQNKQLKEALIELTETQSQLIHNEKMTTLGQLVANIAHEINTPLGAIRSSTESINRMLTNTLSNLPNIIKILSEQQLEQFNKLVEKAVNTNNLHTSREKRTIKYDLIEELDTKKIPQSDRIADLLVDMEVYQENEIYEPFINLPEAVKILQAAYEVSVIAKSNETVKIATDKASKIIITLKNFSRQDHTGEKSLTKINESLESTLILYHNKLKYGIEIIREMADLPLINAYEDELAQVWTNIIHNAIQAIEKKGKIYITTKQEENKILISIRDTGKGIPNEAQTKIFDAFFTTKPTGEGSGLGLNIVKKIIEKHDGKIWFETENIGENTGTTFFVELPIQ